MYGCAQALALIPGVSRSGGTIMAGLFMGYTREAAARYSFLLALPAVFTSGLYKAFKVFTGHEAGGYYGIPSTLLATVIAFGVGYLMIAWFLKYVFVELVRLVRVVPYSACGAYFLGPGVRGYFFLEFRLPLGAQKYPFAVCRKRVFL